LLQGVVKFVSNNHFSLDFARTMLHHILENILHIAMYSLHTVWIQQNQYMVKLEFQLCLVSLKTQIWVIINADSGCVLIQYRNIFYIMILNFKIIMYSPDKMKLQFHESLCVCAIWFILSWLCMFKKWEICEFILTYSGLTLFYFDNKNPTFCDYFYFRLGYLP